MQVLPQCGHAVHEDAPDKVCLVPNDLGGQLEGMWDFTESRINLCLRVCLPAPQVPAW